MPIDIIGLGDIPLIQINTKQFFLKGLDLNILADEVLKTGADASARISNNKTITGVEFEDTYFDYGPETEKFIDCIVSIADTLGMELINRIWAQVHRPFESCNLHDHLGGPDLGFVFYVRVPQGAGKLYFDFGNAGVATLMPIENMLVIFPSYLKHGVTKNLSSDLRISIAGDLRKKI